MIRFKNATTVLTYSFVLLGILGPMVAYFLGLVELAIVGLYAAVPLVLSPVVYAYYGLNERNSRELPTLRIDNRLVLAGTFVLISIAVLLGKQFPRPTFFFVSLSASVTLTLAYSLNGGKKTIALLLLSIIVIVFHVSSTMSPAFYMGSGDTIGMQVSLNSFIHTTDVRSIGLGYQSFPSSFIIAFVTSEMLDILPDLTKVSSNTPLFLVTGSISAMTLWFVYFFTKRVNILPDDYLIVPPSLTCLSIVYWQIGLISVPRAVFALFSVLPIALVAGHVVGGCKASRRDLLVLLTILISLLWFHKISQIFIAIVTTVLLTSVYIHSKVFRESRISLMKLLERNLPVILGVYFVFMVSYLYYAKNTGLIEYVLVRWFFERNNVGFSRVVEGFIDDGWAVLITFGSSSVLLFLYFLAILKAFDNDSAHGINRFVFSSLFFAPLYFPGPMNLSTTLMAKLQLYRLREILFVFIVAAASYGFYTLWSRSDVTRVILLLLVFSGGLFGTANDIYTRDNPLSETGLPSNYLMESDLKAINYGLNTVGADVTSDGRMIDRMIIDKGGRVTNFESNPVYAKSDIESLSTYIILRQGVLKDKGHLWYRFGTIENEYDIPGYRFRHGIYDNGNTSIISTARH